MKIGLFCGSFNPIHIGHLALGNYLCEFTPLEKVWYVVSPQNPLKEKSSLWDDDFRCDLVEIATEGYSSFEVCREELKMPQPSYTIDTLHHLSECYPHDEFTLIIGADNWLIFDKWKSYKEIIQDYSIVIYPRKGYDIDVNHLPKSVTYVDAPVIEVSSQFIREALAEGKDVRYFLHPGVYKAIEDRK